jgi:hypothetical protein
LEPRLRNQQEFASLVGSTTLATFRFITTADRSGRIDLLGAWLRAATADCVVANLSAGGILVRVDCETGLLSGNGWRMYKEWDIERHPQTGTPFDGFPVPFVSDIVEMCRRGHAVAMAFGALAEPVLGWDVVLTDDGPCFLECNPGCELMFQRMSPKPYWHTEEFSRAVLSYLEPVAGERIPLFDLGRPLSEIAERERPSRRP